MPRYSSADAVAGQAGTAALLCRWHETDDRPALIVDEHRTVLWMNGAARQFLAAGDAICLRGAALHAVDAKQDAVLNAHLDRATAMRSCCIVRDHNAAPVLISIERLSQEPGRVLCGLRLLVPTSIAYADLKEIFGLTTAEQRILTDLLHGTVAEEISRIHQLSVATIRSHIKAIYAKLNVSSREALFSKANMFRLY